MNKQQWQSHWKIDDDDMALICLAIELFNGSIVSVKSIPSQGMD